jgi:hypothetical protein
MRAIVLLSVLALSSACASTHDEVREQQAQQARAEFDQIKALAGGWSGKAAHGGDSQSAEVTYRLTAGGNAVVETLFPGTEHEMVTVYYLEGEQLALTHYCVVGNQPHMVAKPGASGPEGTTIVFECHGLGTNMASEDDAHMHTATLEILGNDHIRTTWQMFEKQKQTHAATFDLTRDYTQS